MMSRGVVNPINQLSEAAKRYCQEDIKVFHQQFSKLNIHTNDEVESLANSMKQMEQDMNDNIARLLSTSKELTSTRKEKEQLSTIAKRDALTGVRNKYSYDEELAILQNAMEGGETKFGIVILDLNDLKSINDNYGHDKGDIAIVNLCKVTCDVFSHSPVFRIGGDEFAVILKNDDYDNIKKLIVTFNSTMLSQGSNGDLDPWEKITAAVGYALYDPKKDTGIKSVFHRADAAMYSQKKTMKSRRGLSQSEEPTR
jgi:diguanylate cyclase (GGDEF)-like protein